MPKCIKMQSLVPNTTFRGWIKARPNIIIHSVVNPKYPTGLSIP